MAIPKIVKIEAEGFTWDIVGLRHGRAFHYDPDSALTRHATGIKLRDPLSRSVYPLRLGATTRFHLFSPFVLRRTTWDREKRPSGKDIRCILCWFATFCCTTCPATCAINSWLSS